MNSVLSDQVVRFINLLFKRAELHPGTPFKYDPPSVEIARSGAGIV